MNSDEFTDKSTLNQKGRDLSMGFTQVPNVILECLCKSKLDGTSLKVVLFVVRNTIGWKDFKSSDKNARMEEVSISYRKLAAELGVTRSTVIRSVEKLTINCILKKRLQGSTGHEEQLLSINTNCREWRFTNSIKNQNANNDTPCSITSDTEPVSITILETSGLASIDEDSQVGKERNINKVKRNTNKNSYAPVDPIVDELQVKEKHKKPVGLPEGEASNNANRSSDNELRKMLNRFSGFSKLLEELFRDDGFTLLTAGNKQSLTTIEKLKLLKEWESYCNAAIAKAIRKYLNGGYSQKGKGASYLLAIIKRCEPTLKTYNENDSRATIKEAVLSKQELDDPMIIKAAEQVLDTWNQTKNIGLPVVRASDALKAELIDLLKIWKSADPICEAIKGYDQKTDLYWKNFRDGKKWSLVKFLRYQEGINIGLFKPAYVCPRCNGTKKIQIPHPNNPKLFPRLSKEADCPECCIQRQTA